MPRIPETDIERIKRETDLLALIRSRGLELTKHGSKDWKGLCPFHGDQGTPNLIVSPDKGLWHCMACGKAGNPIQFVQAHDGISFRHAFELLAGGSSCGGQSAIYAARPMIKQNTVPVLPWKCRTSTPSVAPSMCAGEKATRTGCCRWESRLWVGSNDT